MDLKEYEVGGLTLQLDEAEAKRRGATLIEKAKPAPKNKAVKPAVKESK